MTTLYPLGYGSLLVPMAELQRVHEPKMHPAYARRLWPWLESMGGLLGIGGGWRATQPTKPGFAPDGKSFHQSQVFASGTVAYCAVDLVARNPGKVHRGPAWPESATAPQYGLHTFISGEPWHLQPVEIRGWQTWADTGRRDPASNYPLPNEPEDNDMRLTVPPRRILDTRVLGGKVQPGQTVTIETGEQGQGVEVNVTVTQTDGPGYLTAWGAGTAPLVSNVNWTLPNTTIANKASVPLDGSRIRFTVGASAAHVIVDLQGVHP